jgi:ParB family chromosome partitioning protein
MIKSGLGRGLSSLIPGADNEYQKNDGGEEVKNIKVEQIVSNHWQPREYFDHEQLEELTASIKAHGILQPLILTNISHDQYELIAGERRWRAAKVLGLKTVPAIVRSVVDQQKLELALIENIQRQDLNPLEEARSYQRLITEFSLTQEEVAARVGKKRSSVANALRLLELPEEVRNALTDKQISVGHAKVILSAPTVKGQLVLFKKIMASNLSVRQSESQGQKTIVKSHLRSNRQDPILKSLEDVLQQALGTKIHVRQQSGGGGTIIIDYFSSEELQRLVTKISGEDIL